MKKKQTQARFKSYLKMYFEVIYLIYMYEIEP